MHDPNLLGLLNRGAIFLTYCNFPGSSYDNRSLMHVSWKAQPSGWHCLNIDGAAKITNKVACYGGVLRDDNGRWVVGFMKHLGHTSAYMAELTGLYQGVSISTCVSKMCVSSRIMFS